ncbi:MAG TPA: polysaccharide deacetylase family protein [Ignavibacteriaceae bacterium]|nr:polysaccharide deacetylase family protein [Ignavibacteriaceae bacterium]
MKITLFIILSFLSISLTTFSQTENQTKTLLIRCDDLGMSHSVNMAFKELMESGLKFSASVMFPCAWYQEAVDILKEHPEITVGVHLTLNAEWKNYSWGPVAGRDKVPSLVDSDGYFFPSREKFFANNPKAEEIEIELRAQIERAINSGIKISYLDYHMGTAVEKPEHRAIVERLANEYGLAISRYFGEVDVESMYSVDIDKKKDYLFNLLEKIEPGKINLLVCHIGKDQPELQAMIDMNSFGLSEMSKHRNAELNALISAKQQNIFEKDNIKLVNYTDLINEIGLFKMKSPVETGY